MQEATPPMTFEEARADIERLVANVERVFLGKSEAVGLTVAALLAGGHVLIEDVPGVGKTTLARALARSLDCSFQRIQFTNDLLPSDILGTSIFHAAESRFEFQPGPIFHNVVLADEINRTTPKTQSCLLEAMTDGSISVEGSTHPLPVPFLVLATQNPVEHHGTFPLPESQLDRFIIRVRIGYPSPSDEKRLLVEGNPGASVGALEPVLDGACILRLQSVVDRVGMEDSLVDYVVRISQATRSSPFLELGVSPRGTLFLHRMARARALVAGRDYCVPDDVKELAVPTLSHRVVLSAKVNPTGRGLAQASDVITGILDEIPVPI